MYFVGIFVFFFVNEVCYFVFFSQFFVVVFNRYIVCSQSFVKHISHDCCSRFHWCRHWSRSCIRRCCRCGCRCLLCRCCSFVPFFFFLLVLYVSNRWRSGGQKRRSRDWIDFGHRHFSRNSIRADVSSIRADVSHRGANGLWRGANGLWRVRRGQQRIDVTH